MTPKTGTKDWFEWSRRLCIDHLRALLSMKTAKKCAAAIISNWSNGNDDAAMAYHSSCVVAYARPFTNAKSRAGNLRYPVSLLKTSDGFDPDLHHHLLFLRHKLIAHSDYDMFPSKMFTQLIGQDRLPLLLGIEVGGMNGIENHTLAIRYHTHIAACCGAIEQKLTVDGDELSSQARKYPALFAESHNIPEIEETPITLKLGDVVPPPSDSVYQVARPTFSDALEGYRYVTLRHQVLLLDETTAAQYGLTAEYGPGRLRG